MMMFTNSFHFFFFFLSLPFCVNFFFPFLPLREEKQE